MYSVVLLMALSSGADAPGFHRNACHGCYSGCNVTYSCHGCNSCRGERRRQRRCHGCNSCYSSCYSCHGCHGAAPMPAPPARKPEPVKKPPEVKEEEAQAPAPATLLVSLPASARLTIDGAATTSTSSLRVFITPALQTGKDYSYTLQAEIVVDGKTLAVRKNVSMRAGKESRVLLEFPEAVAAR